MQHEAKISGFLRKNRKLETGLLAIGFGLFLMLGLRGLDKINDRAVAAGEANRNVQLSSDVGLDSYMSSTAQTVNTADMQSTVDVKQKAPEANSIGNGNKSEEAKDTLKSEPSKALRDYVVQSTKLKIPNN